MKVVGTLKKLRHAACILGSLSQSLLCLVIAWIYLQVYFLGITSFWRRNQDDGDEKKREALKRMVQKKYEDLGSFSYAEVNVLAAFAVLILLWFFRSPGFIVGWGDLLVTENLYGESLFDSGTKSYMLRVETVQCFRNGSGQRRRHPRHHDGDSHVHTPSGTDRSLGGRQDTKTPRLGLRAREVSVGRASHPRRWLCFG